MNEAQDKFRVEVRKEFANLVEKIMVLGRARILSRQITATECANIFLEEAEYFAKIGRQLAEQQFGGKNDTQ